MEEDAQSELTYRIIGCAFDVYNEIGPCFPELIYQRAMQVALTQAGLRWQREVKVDVVYRDRVLGYGMIDLLVADSVVVELKAVEALHPAFIKQILQYLSASGLHVGLILNFGGLDRLEQKRVVL